MAAAPMTGALFVARHLAGLAVFALAAWGCGRIVTHSLPFRDGLERTVFACAVGIGVLGNAVYVLGLLGGITRPALLAVLAAPTALALWCLARIGRGVFSFDSSARLALLLAPPLLVCLWLALFPPTAFDSTLYHLPAAKAFAERHGVVFLPTLRFPVFPQLVEMLFAGALVLSDDVTAQLSHFFCLAATMAGLLCWARRFGTPRAGVWAAAAWLGNPLVAAIAGAAYVDLGLALFGTFSLFSWQIWREEKDARWLVWSAIFAGLAASTKYLGLFFVAALPLWTLFARRRGDGARDALRFGGIAILVLAPHYGRILAETGNPVFPYFSRWFGDSAWSEPIDPVRRLAPGGDSPLGLRLRQLREPGRLLGIPWRLVVPGRGFGSDPPLSPGTLLLLPLLAGLVLTDRASRLLVLLGLAYGASWYLLVPDKRFLLPVLPAMTAVATAGLDRLLASWRRGRAPWVTVALTLLFVAPGLLWSARTASRRGPLPGTPRERDVYLARTIPVYRALQELNETLGARYTVYGLFCENAAYFARGRFLGDHFGPYRYALVVPSLDDPRRLHSVLRTAGATHLLVGRDPGELLRPADAGFRALFAPLPSPSGTALYALR